MNKKMNSFTKIITVLLALLLLGVAVGPASAAPVVSGLNVSSSTDIVTVGGNITLKITANETNLTADSIWINKMNVTSSFVPNSTGVEYSAYYIVQSGDADVSATQIAANVTLKNSSSGLPSNAYSTVATNNLSVNAGGYHLDNISSSAVADSTDKFMMILTAERYSNFTLKSNRTNDTFDVSSVTTNFSGKAIFNITSNLTGSAMITANGTNIDFMNLTNGNVLFVAPAPSNLDNISSSAVANNTDKFTMILTAPNGSTFNLKSNRSQDTFDVSSVTTNSSGQAIFNITSTLAGRATITANGTNLNLTDDGNVLFVAGPAAKLVFFGANSAAGVTETTPGTINETIAVQDAFGNNITGEITPTLITLTKTGSATFPSGNSKIITNNISFVVNDTVVETTTIGALPNATFNAISKNMQFFGPVSKLVVTLSKSTLNANNSDALVATVQLQDAANNSITSSGISVTLTANNASLLAITPPSNITDANGATTFTVMANAISGSTFLTAIDTSGNNGNSLTVTLNPAPSLSSSTVINSSAAIKTGLNNTITATIKDYNNVAISGKSVTFNITTGDAKFANNGAQIYTTTTASTGKAMANITSTNASALNLISVNVTIADENGVIKQVGSLQNFTVTPGSPTQYSITPGTSAGLTNVKGTTQQFNITVKDSIGNLNTTANGTINITTDNQALGNMSNGTTVLNNLTVTMLNGNASFNYTVNSTTIGTAVLTLNSTSLGIVDTTVTITTSGATGVAISVDKSVQDTSSDVQVSAQLTGPSGNLAINDTDIIFIVKDAAGVIQSISTNPTNTSGIAVYSFTQSDAGVYTVTASNVTLGISNSTTVTFAGSAASIVVTANNTSPLMNTTVTINATVKDSSGITSGSLGTETISFLADNGTFSPASVSITNGVASTTYTKATAGSVTITAFFNATLQNTTTVTFTAASLPTLTVSATPTTVTTGTATNVTFTVTSSGTGTPDNATVTLSGAATGSGTTNASGFAVISVNATSAGTITATASKTGYNSGTTTMTASSGTVTPALVSSITPNSRNAQLGTPVTLFMSVINYGTGTATDVNIEQESDLNATVSYQQWNGTAFIGSPNTPADIAAGETANYVLTINATSAFDSSSMTFNVSSTNGATAPISAVNTLTVAASATPIADVIMMSTNLNVSGSLNNWEDFAVATTNVGANATNVTFNVVVPSSITGLITQVNQTYTNGSIKGPATGLTINAGEQPTFAVFVYPTQAISLDLVSHRITVELVDGNGTVIGAQSVAISTK